MIDVEFLIKQVKNKAQTEKISANGKQIFSGKIVLTINKGLIVHSNYQVTVK